MARPFRLWGGNRAAFKDQTSKEVLLSGPAGTGKTLTNLSLILWFCGEYPGARCLIVRKTRESLTESVLVTWERDVLGFDHPVLTTNPTLRRVRQSYRLPRGSTVVVGGMDKPDKVLSSEWDLIYCPEALELELVDWETLGGRLRASAGPFDQIRGDCNPGSPHSWLYKRCTDCNPPKCKLYETRHYENPRYYDQLAKKWTAEGRRYVGSRLAQLTGTRRDRFLLGLWKRAEGLVYDFDPAVHLLPESWRPPSAWPRVWAIDWGKTAPTVLQMWAVDPMTLAVYLYREFFRTNTRPDLLGRWARQELERGEKRPQAVVCDHDDEPKREFERESGLHLQLADKADRDKGIQEMQARFDKGPQTGQPRIFFHPNALAHKPDPYLEERGIPSCTVAEILGYVWNEDFLKDEPIDINDHGCDSARYLIRYVSTRMVAGGTPEFKYNEKDRRSWVDPRTRR